MTPHVIRRKIGLKARLSTLSISLLTLLSTSASAGVWINGQQATQNGVRVDVNWTHSSSTGKYRAYIDDDNTPFYGGSVDYFTSKPWTTRELPPCTQHTIAIEYEKMYGGWPFKWWSFKRDGTARVQTRSAAGTTCATSYTTGRRNISGEIDLSGLNADEVRVCYKHHSGNQPELHPLLCSRLPWSNTHAGINLTTQLGGGYTPKYYRGYNVNNGSSVSKKRSGAIRKLNPSNSYNFNLTNLSPACRYDVSIYAFNNGTKVANDTTIVKTSRNGWSDGFGCFIGIFSKIAPMSDQNARIGVAILNDDTFEVSTAYEESIMELYKRNAELRMKHEALYEKSHSVQENRERSTDWHERNRLLTDAISNGEFFAKWQQDLKNYDLSITQFVKRYEDGKVRSKLLSLSKDNKRWKEIMVEAGDVRKFEKLERVPVKK